MAASSYTLKDIAVADVVFSLTGATANGAEYKLATRSLALPLTLGIAFNLGAPGSKGNDHLLVTFKDTVENSSTGVISTGSVKVDVSVPRDGGWTTTKTEDLMAYVASLLSAARIPNIADAIVP